MLINKLALMIVAAYCTALVNGQDPSLFVNHQDYETTFSLLRDGLFSHNYRELALHNMMIAVYCVCRSPDPDDGSTMIQCDGKNCKEW